MRHISSPFIRGDYPNIPHQFGYDGFLRVLCWGDYSARAECAVREWCAFRGETVVLFWFFQPKKPHGGCIHHYGWNWRKTFFREDHRMWTFALFRSATSACRFAGEDIAVAINRIVPRLCCVAVVLLSGPASCVLADAAAAQEEAPPTTNKRQQPSFLDTDTSAAQEELPAATSETQQPSFLDSDTSEWSVTEQLRGMEQRLTELEATRTANEDAIRTIINQSFANRGSNITDAVVFGGTLETLTFWQEDFDGVAESDIVLDTAELDFEILLNPWTLGSFVASYTDGQDFLFPTTQDDEVGVDRLTIRQAWITVGDITRYPLFVTAGRDVVPFGISTGDPVTNVLTITDPLTIEVFESTEDFILIGAAWPTPPPPPPLAPNAPPGLLPPQPLLINPLVRRTATRVCSYCGAYDKPPPLPPAPVPICPPLYSAAVYFYNGDSVRGPMEEDHIEHMGGTLGYQNRGVFGSSGIPWTIDADVDVISSVFDSDFLRFQYRHFLEQIGFVPGMAAHVKSNIGPVALVLEWNGAITNAEFVDDAGNPVDIQPGAWQVSLGYQFDWNPQVEVIGMQGTYLAMSYSESYDLAGVTDFVGDPLAPTLLRVGFVPERRLSVGVGEWVLDGVRVAVEYSHIVDYDVADGGTGNSANGYFFQLTYEF
jgi:hypothetical protein